MSRIDWAVVVCPRPGLPEAGALGLRVAGLPLLTRALLTAQRAGIQRFAVVASASQHSGLGEELDGDVRLRGRVRWVEPTEDPGPQPGYRLVLLPWVVLEVGALRRWLLRVAEGARVAAPDVTGIGPLAVPTAFLPQCIEAVLHGRKGLLGFLERLDEERQLVRVPWEGMQRQMLDSPGDVPAVERAMLSALRSPEDGPIVDRFVNRAVSARLTRWLVASCVTPNQVTVASLVTGLAGAWLLGGEGVVRSLVGLALIQLSVILDHVDGEVARLKFHNSVFGKWLDNFSDHVVDLAAIAFLTWRVAGDGQVGQFTLLGVGAALGVTADFLVVFWWSVSGARPEVRATTQARFVARLLAVLANRDCFCGALWVTVLLGRPSWFLWALSLGANAYWAGWLWIYGLPRRPANFAAANGARH